MAVREAWAASAAKRVVGHLDERGWRSSVSCLASVCHRPNALHVQGMPCSAAGFTGDQRGHQSCLEGPAAFLLPVQAGM